MSTRNLALVWLSACLLSACQPEPENEAPIAHFTVFPLTGDTETEFIFDASGCSDPEDPDSLIKVRWDYENDGYFDYPWVFTRINKHRFDTAGIYQVRLQVKDQLGLTADLIQELQVDPGNRPPALPFMPNPPDSSNNIRYTGRLSWVGVDPDDDSVTFDVFIGTSKNPSLLVSGLTIDECYPGDLLSGRRYYWKVVATDLKGASIEGPLWSFSIHSGIYEKDSMTDERDGQRYPTIRLNRTWWMARNLNYDFGEFSVFYENDPRNGEKYGRLYSPWLTDTIVCPPGWRLPREHEWAALEAYLGMSSDQVQGFLWRGNDQARQMFAGGTSGLEILPAGYKEYNGGFVYKEERALFYSRYNNARILLLGFGKIYRADGGFEPFADYASVRCIRRY